MLDLGPRRWLSAVSVFLLAFSCSIGNRAVTQRSVANLNEGDTGDDILQFHFNAERLGWRSSEKILKPSNISSTTFGKLWESAPLDSVLADDQNGHLVRDPQGKPQVFAPHLFASPLY